MKRSTWHLFLALAFLFRLVLIPNPGFEADVSFWKSWGLAVLDLGVVKGLPLTNFNYPAPFAYFLGVMVWIYSWFADPHNFDQMWNNANLPFLAIAKLFPIAADFGLAALFLYIGKNVKKLGFPEVKFSLFGLSLYQLSAIVYLLSPLSLIDGALWGQIDSVGVLLFLVGFLGVLTKKPFIAGVVFMVAMMTKLQNMIYGPVFFLFIWQYMGYGGLLRAVGGAGLAFLGLNSEYFLNHQANRVIDSLIGNYDYFPWLSLNAYNPWWIFSGAQGMQGSDKVMAIGIANAKTVGLYVFSSFYLFAGLHQLLGKNTKAAATPIKTFLESLIIVNGAFFLFQTQSHDRYAFPLAVFLLLWLPFFLEEAKNKGKHITSTFKSFLFYYAFYTVIYFYNLHNALIVNYPKNGIPFLNTLNVPALTIGASVLLTALFFVFLYYLIRHTRASGYAFILALAVGGTLITLRNMPLINNKPVFLGSITPISATAGYGNRQVNMPANAAFGFSKWSRPSVQYAFYKHGIGTHAPAREVYDINKKFRTLSTDYGVDTNGGPQGSVTFEVYGDGKKLFESQLIKRFELPRHADIDITGVRTLELVVTDGGNGNTDDHADWLNTMLYP